MKHPRLILRLLKVICPEHLFEEIEGDLMQRFSRDVEQYGVGKARRRMIWSSIRFLRPGIVLRNKITMINPFQMTGHFLKVMFRVTAKNKVLSLINVSGLVLGMSAFAFILLYVKNERSYDSFHKKRDQIFRVRQDRYTGEELTRQWTAGAWGIGSALRNEFPEVLRYVNVNRGGMRSTVLANGSTYFKEERIYYASEDFFKVFSYELTEGVDSLVLNRPFTMVITQALAKKYFGDVNPIGKTLRNNGEHDYEITGVVKDPPDNTHLKFDALLSFESLLKIIGPKDTQELMNNWGWSGNYTYIELDPASDSETFEAKIPVLVEKKAGTYLREWGEQMKFVLQAVPSIHLNSDFKDEMEPNGDAKAVNFLQWVAVFILVMAWINYVNLSTARSIERAKEVGIRKVLGSYRLQLIRQFLLESFIVNAIAMIVTALIMALLLSDFSSFVQRKIELPPFNSDLLTAIGGILGVGLVIAGIYPALVLSGFSPLSIIKGAIHGSMSANYLRKGLVSVQFIFSVVMIAGTATVYRQLTFMRGEDLGINGEQVLVVQGPLIADSTFSVKYENFRQSLLNLPEVQLVSGSTDVPGRSVWASNGGVRIVGKEVSEGNAFRIIMSDEDFSSIYGMKLLQGRTFSRERNEAWKTCLVNETAMKLLGFNDPQKVIGQKIYVWNNTLEIVGVLKDYHHESLKKKVDQLIFVCDKDARDYISIKIGKAESSSQFVNQVQEKYSSLFPGNPFTFFFADDYYNQQYQSDQQFANVFSLFTTLAIIIACLGLFGLSSYMAFQRVREVCIRKVMGASVNQIAFLVSREFMMIVLVSNLIALPFAFFVMNTWLSGFAYRISLGASAFVIPAICSVLVALITISFQSIKVALTNPVDSLRSE